MKDLEKRYALTKNEQKHDRHPYCCFESPVGMIRIEEDQKGITSLQFVGKESEPARMNDSGQSGRYLADARAQLSEYFAGSRKGFELPLSVSGTEFQMRVWKALCEIPYGETRSYQEIAAAVGNIRAARAVGMANNRNLLPILIPCHRVIGKSGKLVGYSDGIHIKQYLLELEAKNSL